MARLLGCAIASLSIASACSSEPRPSSQPPDAPTAVVAPTDAGASITDADVVAVVDAAPRDAAPRRTTPEPVLAAACSGSRLDLDRLLSKGGGFVTVDGGRIEVRSKSVCAFGGNVEDFAASGSADGIDVVIDPLVSPAGNTITLRVHFKNTSSMPRLLPFSLGETMFKIAAYDAQDLPADYVMDGRMCAVDRAEMQFGALVRLDPGGEATATVPYVPLRKRFLDDCSETPVGTIGPGEYRLEVYTPLRGLDQGRPVWRSGQTKLRVVP